MNKGDLGEKLVEEGQGVIDDLRAHFGNEALRIPRVAPGVGGIALCSCCGKPEEHGDHAHANSNHNAIEHHQSDAKEITWKRVSGRDVANLGVNKNKEALRNESHGTLFGIILVDMNGKPTQSAMPAMIVRHDKSEPQLLALQGHTFDYSQRGSSDDQEHPVLDMFALSLLNEGKDLLHPVVGTSIEHSADIAAGATLGHSTQIIRALTDQAARHQLTNNIHATHEAAMKSEGISGYLTAPTTSMRGSLSVDFGDTVVDSRFKAVPVTQLPEHMTLVRVAQTSLPETSVIAALAIWSANQRNGGSGALDQIKQGIDQLT